MDDDTEVIKQQMAETRESLANKVEALENKVIGTVQTATDTVASTVESVSDTVASVKDTVHDTVESVKGGVRDAADSVKSALDIEHHARHNPWTVFCGAVVVGFVGGYLLTPRKRDPRDRRWPDMTGGPYMSVPAPWSAAYGDGLPPPQAGTRQMAPPQQKKDEGPGWIDKLEPAIGQLKEMAIGAAVGMIGKMLMQSAPPALRSDLSGVVDQFTTALGGKPMPHESELPLSQPTYGQAQPPQQEQQQKPHNRLSGAKRHGNGRSTS